LKPVVASRKQLMHASSGTKGVGTAVMLGACVTSSSPPLPDASSPEASSSARPSSSAAT
jgi:hypothetical protein